MKFVRAAGPLILAAVVAWCAAGCRSRPAIDSFVPAGTIVLGGLDLNRLRAAPLYPKLPSAAHAFAESYRAAERVLAAWNGTGVLVIAQGAFREPPPGATLAAPNIALMGAPDSVHAATAQYRAGKTGAPGLLAYAATLGSPPVWVVAQGGVVLPLSGNGRNVNRLFRNLEYVALAAEVGPAVDLRITAAGHTEQAASEFEENLRALLSLASAAENLRPQIAALLDSVQIRRDGATATAHVTLPPEALEMLAGTFAR